MATDATVATVPIGYADGVPRRLFGRRREVLVGGRRRPIVGVVTMDQLMVDCRRRPVAVGDEVVLLGRQGDEQIRAEEWAQRLGTIGYEIVCGIGARVPASSPDARRRAGATVSRRALVTSRSPCHPALVLRLPSLAVTHAIAGALAAAGAAG